MSELLPTSVACHDLEYSPAAQFHPSGDWLAVANGQGVLLVESASARTLGVVPTDMEVASIAFAQSGESLCLVGEGIEIWNIASINDASRIYQGNMPIEFGFEGDAIDSVFDDRMFLSCYGRCCILSTPTGRLIGEFELPHKGSCVFVGRNPRHGMLAAVDCFERGIAFVTLDGGRVVLEILFDCPTDIAFSADLSVCAAKERDESQVRVLSSEIGWTTIRSFPEMGQKFIFSSDRNYLISDCGESDQHPYVTISDLQTGHQQKIRTQAVNIPTIVSARDFGVFATVSSWHESGEATEFWDLANGNRLGSAHGHAQLSQKLFSPCGRWFASISSRHAEETSFAHRSKGAIVITEYRQF